MENQFCPCCGRHCSLDAPHCERGKAYAQTGEIPAPNNARNGGHDHGEHGCHGHGGHGKDMWRKERYASMDIDSKLVSNIRDLGHTVRALSDGKASQSRILIMLNDGKPITQSELTERLCVQSGTASEVIGKLEKAGLIERGSNEKDKRTCELKLTAEGVIKANEASAERETRYGEMFGCLTEEQKSELLGLLEKLNRDWQHRYCDRGHHGECCAHDDNGHEPWAHEQGCHKHGECDREEHGRHGHRHRGRFFDDDTEA